MHVNSIAVSFRVYRSLYSPHVSLISAPLFTSLLFFFFWRGVAFDHKQQAVEKNKKEEEQVIPTFAYCFLHSLFFQGGALISGRGPWSGWPTRVMGLIWKTLLIGLPHAWWCWLLVNLAVLRSMLQCSRDVAAAVGHKYKLRHNLDTK